MDEGSKGGMGCLIRADNDNGEWMGGFSGHLGACTNPAARQGLSYPQHGIRGLRN